jgi:Domain of unknown function (DUF4440)
MRLEKITLTVVLYSVLSFAADPREAQVVAANDAFWNCWDARDTACLDKLVTDDFVQVPRSSNRFVDKAGFLAGMKAGSYSRLDPGQTRQAGERKVRFYGDTAVLTYVGLPVTPSEVPHYMTFVWVNVNGKWLLADMHVSRPSQSTSKNQP